jgi:glycosyltransferase involved in cell wall biosynthesis
MSAPLSVVILAKNEAGNIGRCARSVAWCDDVVVIDDDSTDATARLAAAEGARVVPHPFESFARQRNWALESADLRGEWVLMLDADEVVTEPLRVELQRLLTDVAKGTVAFRMCRKTIFMDRWLKYSDGFPVWIMRLVRRGRAWFADQGHGEVPVPEVEGRVETVREPFLHYPFSRGIGEWVDRHNRYATREAALEMQQDSDWAWRDILGRDRAVRRSALRAASRRMPLRPVLRFGYQYVWRLGFLDGRAGLAFSCMMAAYEGLIVLKRWELRQKEP